MLLQVLRDNHHRLLDTRLLRMNMHLRILRRLIRRTNSRELFDLPRASFLVQAFGIALLGFLDGHIDEDFDEGEGGFVVFGVSVEFAGDLAIGFVGGDEGG